MNLRNLNKVLGKLATTNRYSDTRLINPESVLEHTGFVAMICLFISQALNKDGCYIDEAVLLKKAILHDIEESITGDIISSTKHATRDISASLGEYAETCAKQIFIKLDATESYEFWLNAKAETEGFIVSVADLLAVVYKLDQEINQFGNLHLRSHVYNSIISALKKKLTMSKTLFLGNSLNNLIEEGIEICQKILKST